MGDKPTRPAPASPDGGSGGAEPPREHYPQGVGALASALKLQKNQKADNPTGPFTTGSLGAASPQKN